MKKDVLSNIIAAGFDSHNNKHTAAFLPPPPPPPPPSLETARLLIMPLIG